MAYGQFYLLGLPAPAPCWVAEGLASNCSLVEQIALLFDLAFSGCYFALPPVYP